MTGLQEATDNRVQQEQKRTASAKAYCGKLKRKIKSVMTKTNVAKQQAARKRAVLEQVVVKAKKKARQTTSRLTTERKNFGTVVSELRTEVV